LIISREAAWDIGEATSGRAFSEAMAHAVMLSGMYYAMLNLYAAALYHLTEQHIVDLCTRILDYHQPRGVSPTVQLDGSKKTSAKT
jgi:hypothetical protein